MSRGSNSIPAVPDGMVDLLKGLARNVLREKPENIYEFAAEYFENLLRERDGSLDKGYEKFREYDRRMVEFQQSKESGNSDEFGGSGNGAGLIGDKYKRGKLVKPCLPPGGDMGVNGVAMQVNVRESKLKRQPSNRKKRLESMSKSGSQDSSSSDKEISTAENMKNVDSDEVFEEEEKTNDDESIGEATNSQKRVRKLSSKKLSQSNLIAIKEESRLEEEDPKENRSKAKSATKKGGELTQDAAAFIIQKAIRTYVTDKKQSSGEHENETPTNEDCTENLSEATTVIENTGIQTPLNDIRDDLSSGITSEQEYLIDDSIGSVPAITESEPEENAVEENVQESPKNYRLAEIQKIDRLRTPESDSGLSEKSFNMKVHENESENIVDDKNIVAESVAALGQVTENISVEENTDLGEIKINENLSDTDAEANISENSTSDIAPTVANEISEIDQSKLESLTDSANDILLDQPLNQIESNLVKNEENPEIELSENLITDSSDPLVSALAGLESDVNGTEDVTGLLQSNDAPEIGEKHDKEETEVIAEIEKNDIPENDEKKIETAESDRIVENIALDSDKNQDPSDDIISDVLVDTEDASISKNAENAESVNSDNVSEGDNCDKVKPMKNIVNVDATENGIKSAHEDTVNNAELITDELNEVAPNDVIEIEANAEPTPEPVELIEDKISEGSTAQDILAEESVIKKIEKEIQNYVKTESDATDTSNQLAPDISTAKKSADNIQVESIPKEEEVKQKTATEDSNRTEVDISEKHVVSEAPTEEVFVQKKIVQTSTEVEQVAEIETPIPPESIADVTEQVEQQILSDVESVAEQAEIHLNASSTENLVDDSNQSENVDTKEDTDSLVENTNEVAASSDLNGQDTAKENDHNAEPTEYDDKVENNDKIEQLDTQATEENVEESLVSHSSQNTTENINFVGPDLSEQDSLKDDENETTDSEIKHDIVIDDASKNIASVALDTNEQGSSTNDENYNREVILDEANIPENSPVENKINETDEQKISEDKNEETKSVERVETGGLKEAEHPATIENEPSIIENIYGIDKNPETAIVSDADENTLNQANSNNETREEANDEQSTEKSELKSDENMSDAIDGSDETDEKHSAENVANENKLVEIANVSGCDELTTEEVIESVQSDESKNAEPVIDEKFETESVEPEFIAKTVNLLGTGNTEDADELIVAATESTSAKPESHNVDTESKTEESINEKTDDIKSDEIEINTADAEVESHSKTIAEPSIPIVSDDLNETAHDESKIVDDVESVTDNKDTHLNSDNLASIEKPIEKDIADTQSMLEYLEYEKAETVLLDEIDAQNIAEETINVNSSASTDIMTINSDANDKSNFISEVNTTKTQSLNEATDHNDTQKKTSNTNADPPSELYPAEDEEVKNISDSINVLDQPGDASTVEIKQETIQLQTEIGVISEEKNEIQSQVVRPSAPNYEDLFELELKNEPEDIASIEAENVTEPQHDNIKLPIKDEEPAEDQDEIDDSFVQPDSLDINAIDTADHSMATDSLMEIDVEHGDNDQDSLMDFKALDSLKMEIVDKDDNEKNGNQELDINLIKEEQTGNGDKVTPPHIDVKNTDVQSLKNSQDLNEHSPMVSESEIMGDVIKPNFTNDTVKNKLKLLSIDQPSKDHSIFSIQEVDTPLTPLTPRPSAFMSDQVLDNSSENIIINSSQIDTKQLEIEIQNKTELENTNAKENHANINVTEAEKTTINLVINTENEHDLKDVPDINFVSEKNDIADFKEKNITVETNKDQMARSGPPKANDNTMSSTQENENVSETPLSIDLPSSDLSDSETDQIEQKFNESGVDETSRDERDDISEIENFDLSSCGEDSLEAMYYIIRKNEILLDKMHKIDDDPDQAQDDDRRPIFPEKSTENLNTAIREVSGQRSIKSFLSTESSDGVVMKQVSNENESFNDFLEKDWEEEEERSYVNPAATEDEYLNPILASMRQNENLLNRMHAKALSMNDAIDRDDSSAVDFEENDTFNELPIDDMRLGNIQQKMLASSMSEADSDYFERNDKSQKITRDDFNISTALDHIPGSTDSESTIESAATKIQAGAKGFYIQKRVRRSTSVPEKHSSIGNAAIDKSLDDLVRQHEQYEMDATFDEDSGENSDILGITEVKVEQRKAYITTDITEINESDEQYENIIVSRNFEEQQTDSMDVVVRDQFLLATPQTGEYSTAQRRMTLHRGDALQRNSTPEEGVSRENSSKGDNDNENKVQEEKEETTAIADEEPDLESTVVEENSIQSESTQENFPAPAKPVIASRTSPRSPRIRSLGPRQRSMPVQIEAQFIRIMPKHSRKRIKSANSAASSKDKRKQF